LSGAFLIVNQLKDIENREWATRYRGLLYVHAGKTLDTEGYAYVQRTFPAIALPPLAQLERGGIVGQVRIVDCVEASASPWFFGRYGFVLQDGMPLPFRPLPGKLGLFDVAPDADPYEGSGQLRLRL
jgi:hypothetical protein